MGRLGPARRPAARAVRRRGRGARAAYRCCCRRPRRPDAARRRGRPARRAGGHRRRGRRPGAVRRGAAPAHGRLARRTATPGSSRCSTPPTRPACRRSGVCRGMQVMAVHAGGVARPAHARPGRPRRAQPGRRRVRRRRRCATADGIAGCATLVGDAASSVQLPPPPVGARATPASTAVGVGRRRHRSRRWRRPGDRFCVGVQWHPEMAARRRPVRGAGGRGRRTGTDAREQTGRGPVTPVMTSLVDETIAELRANHDRLPGRRRGADRRPADRAERRRGLDRRRRAVPPRQRLRDQPLPCWWPQPTRSEDAPTNQDVWDRWNALAHRPGQPGSSRATGGWWSCTSR